MTEVADALPAFVPIFHQAPADRMVECGRRHGLNRTDWRRISFQDRGAYAERTLSLKRSFARHHLIQHGAKGKDVAAPVDFVPFHLFWRHVRKRAHHGSIYRQRLR